MFLGSTYVALVQSLTAVAWEQDSTDKLISWWTREQWPRILPLLCDSDLEVPSSSQDNFNDPITTFLIFSPCSFNLLAKTAERGFWKFRLIQVTCQCIKERAYLSVYLDMYGLG